MFRVLSKFQMCVLIPIVTLLFAGLALAQDDPTPATVPTVEVITTVEAPVEEPPPVEQPPVEEVPPIFEAPTIEELLTAVETTLMAILAGVIASPVTSAAVSIVKWAGDKFNIALIKNASGSQINTVMVVALVGSVWIARFFGVTEDLNSAFKVILALSSVIGGVSAGARASSGWYGNVTRDKVALVGYQRASERKAYKEYSPATG